MRRAATRDAQRADAPPRPGDRPTYQHLEKSVANRLRRPGFRTQARPSRVPHAIANRVHPACCPGAHNTRIRRTGYLGRHSPLGSPRRTQARPPRVPHASAPAPDVRQPPHDRALCYRVTLYLQPKELR